MEFNVTVPTKFNNGEPVPALYFQEFENFLEDEFKGWTKTPVSGGWVGDGGNRVRDESIKYSIYAEDFSPELLDAIANVIGSFWEQSSVYYDVKPSEGYFKEPETEPVPEHL